jgi:homoserine dehydrogenase
MNIAILGYGVVGSGVAGVLARCADGVKKRSGVLLNLKAIVDIRDFPDDPYGHLVTKDAAAVFADPTVDIVVETIGGTGIAYEYTKRALAAGKNVVTSNKELVAVHGPELLQLAADHRVRYRYEASVGGGIPIIRPLHNDLAANRIDAISGIVNGTTNFILYRMEKDGVDFADALVEAQANGYAEQDPSADIDGLDACRKLAIMASIVLNEHVPSEEIYTVGIRDLTVRDSRLAAALGYNLKLIASMKRGADERVSLIVAPHLVADDQPLAATHGVFNAIQVTGDSVGDTLFYGQGAGTWPTASAVVADVIEIATVPYTERDAEVWPESTNERILPHEDAPIRAVLRFEGQKADAVALAEKLRDLDPVVSDASQEDAVLIVGGDLQEPTGLTEGQLHAALEALPEIPVSVLRIL